MVLNYILDGCPCSLKLYTQVPLVRAFNVCVNGYCYISREINHFLKSFRVVSIKNAAFSKLETRFSCFETRFVRGSSIVPVLSCDATLLLIRPDLSKKIEGPLLAGYKLINNNNFKDRSFQQYLILDILTNPVRVTLTEKGKILGKNPLPVSLFTYYSLRINLPFS